MACSEIIEALQAAVGPGLNLSSNLQRMCAFIRPSAMPAQATGIFFLWREDVVSNLAVDDCRRQWGSNQETAYQWIPFENSARSVCK